MTDGILVTSYATEDLDAGTRKQITELCVAAHQEDDFKNLFAYVPSGGWHFLAHAEQIMVSHAMVTTRWLQPEGYPPLRTGYVDAVSTLPEYAGHGYGSAVMRQLAHEIDNEYVIACLETDKVGFYQRLGWQAWRGPLAGRSEAELIPTPDQNGIMILRLSRTPELDFNTLLTIECQTGRIW